MLNKVGSQLPTGYILDQVKGTVFILQKGKAKSEPAQEDQTVQEGDEIITKSGSEATLALGQKAVVQISGDSAVNVGELSQPSSGSFISRLFLLGGRLLSQVEKLNSSHSVFEIEAGGVICGVRGTAFEVQKEGHLIGTSTFEGTVEMKKGDQTQNVAANYHSDFSTEQGLFLLRRALNEREKERFQEWQKLRELESRRQKEREQSLKSFDSLPQTEKTQLWEKLQKVRAIDRFKILRRIMREKNQQDRLKLLDEATQARVDLLKNRQERETKPGNKAN